MWPSKLIPWLKKVCFDPTAIGRSQNALANPGGRRRPGGVIDENGEPVAGGESGENGEGRFGDPSEGSEGGDGSSRLTKLELRQISNGSADSVVDSWEFTPDSDKIVIDDLAMEICQRAQSDCEEAFTGPAAYTVFAFFGGNDFPGTRAPAARFISATRTDTFEETEQPNAKGFAIQQMRHNEGLIRMLVANTTSMQHHTEKLLERSFARIETLESERMNTIQIVEAMLDGKGERESRAEAAREVLARQNDAWQQAKLLLPTVVNKITGKKLMPETSTPTTEIVHELIGSLTPAQIAQLQGVFTPTQMIGFATLYDSRGAVEEQRKADAEARKRGASGASPGASSGASSGNGDSGAH
jgi:hypothetical protein